jgi:hypothetical protein
MFSYRCPQVQVNYWSPLSSMGAIRKFSVYKVEAVGIQPRYGKPTLPCRGRRELPVDRAYAWRGAADVRSSSEQDAADPACGKSCLRELRAALIRLSDSVAVPEIESRRAL